MPIRFRCPFCNQLLGISRRKGGSVVRCPTCQGQLHVPVDEEATYKPPNGGPDPLLFERNDFDELFKPEAAPAGFPSVPKQAAGQGASPKPALPPGGSPVAADAPSGELPEPVVEVEWVVPPSRLGSSRRGPGGLVLSPVLATVALGSIVAGVVLAFLLGLLMGYLLFRAPAAKAASNPLRPGLMAPATV